MTLVQSRVWRWLIAFFAGWTSGLVVGTAAQYVYGVEWMVLLYSATAAVPGYGLTYAWLSTMASTIPVPPAAPAPDHLQRVYPEIRTRQYDQQIPYDVAALRERICCLEDRLVGVETRRVEQDAQRYREDDERIVSLSRRLSDVERRITR